MKELITNDARKTVRPYKSKPFKPTAAQKRHLPLTGEQIVWALSKHPKWALGQVEA